MTLLQPMMAAALVVSGMGVALLGSIKVPLARRLQIDEARVGGLVSLFGFILIPVILTAGFLTDAVGKDPAGKGAVLIAGSIFLAASVAVLAQARSYAWALVAVLLLGGAWSVLINVGNVLTPLAFARGPADEAYAFNLANVFFGLGAFLTPLVVALLLHRTSLPVAVSVLAVLSLVPALLALGIDFSALAVVERPGGSPGPDSAWEELRGLLANPILWLCGLALFFYGPLEASMGAWATTYLGDQGVSPARSSALLSSFWLTYMAARLVTALTLPAGGEKILILALSLASVAVLAGIVLSRGPMLATVLVPATGLVFGPIFPTIMAVLLASCPPEVHGRAVGVFFAVGGLGWSSIPLLIGAYANRTGVQRAFSIAVAAAVGLSVIAALLLLR